MPNNVRPRVFTQPVEVTSPLDGIPIQQPEAFRDEMPVLGFEPVPVVEVESYSSVTLQLPQSIYAEYARVAAAQDQTVEEVMQHRLASCKSHNAIRGLWWTDSERAQLEELVQKRPLESAAQALTILNKAGTFTLDGLEITLTPAQKRVLSLNMYGGRTPKSFLEAMIKKELRA